MYYVNTTDDFVCVHARQIGKRVAERCGLRGEDAEDCACGFVARTWEYLHSERGQAIGALPEMERDAWMVCCARHFALNFCRHLALQRRKECPPEPVHSEDPAIHLDQQPPDLTPIARIIHEGDGTIGFWGLSAA